MEHPPVQQEELKWIVVTESSDRVGVKVWHLWRENCCPKRKAIVFFPGNPGCPGFYLGLAREITRTCGHYAGHVYIVGHTGHGGKGYAEPLVFDDKEQVEHKRQLLEEHFHAHHSVFFLGHSFGAWTVIQLLRTNIGGIVNVGGSVLLWPTVMNLRESPDGVVLSPLLGSRLVRAVVRAFVLLLRAVTPRKVLLRLFQVLRPDLARAITDELLVVGTTENALWLGHKEMENIRDLDVATFREHASTIAIVSSLNDRFSPPAYFEEMKDKLGSHLHMHLFAKESALRHRAPTDNAEPIRNEVVKAVAAALANFEVEDSGDGADARSRL